MDELLSVELRDIRAKTRALASGPVATLAEQVDRESLWPEHTFNAMRDTELMGLQVPGRLGGLEHPTRGV